MEVLTHFCRNLSIGHLVGGFDADDACSQPFAGEALFELALGLARTEDQDGVGASNARDDFVVVLVEMAGEAPVALVLAGTLSMLEGRTVPLTEVLDESFVPTWQRAAGEA